MEGPSVYLLAEKLHGFVGAKIKSIKGNAKIDQNALKKQSIVSIYSFGKRLIIQCADVAITIHFLMYGSYRINEERPDMMPRLQLVTSKGTINFYNCAIKLFKTSALKRRLPLSRDIVSPRWSAKKLIPLLKKYENETIDDVLLDQSLFPGIGNIIKNEVLFISKLAPSTKIKKLSAQQLHNVAHNAHVFSKKFLELRRVFQLKKNLSIYRKSLCPMCSSKIVRQKTGMTRRWSYYCLVCQK